MSELTTINTNVSAPTEPMPDLEAIYKRLKELEKEILRLQEMVRRFVPPHPGTQPTDHPYIEKVPTILGGEPIIKGTRTPVRAIVEYWRFGDPPEVIMERLPYLRLAQVCDALGYYDDHREEIEHYIAINRVPVDD